MRSTNATRRAMIRVALGGALATPALRGARAAAPYFKLNLLIPDFPAPRMAWGTLIARQIAQLGIEVTPAYLSPDEIATRRSLYETHVDGGWDMVLERCNYASVKPVPSALFGSRVPSIAGQGLQGLEDGPLDRAMDDYATSLDLGAQDTAIKAFQKRWLEIEPATILLYPQDLIATNPNLTGLTTSTARPAFPPHPERWTIGGRGPTPGATFACWPPPTSLLPLYWRSYPDSNAAGPVYDQLMEYDGDTLGPALAAGVEQSPDGKRWVIDLRPGVVWHNGEPFTAADAKFTFDTILDPETGSDSRAILAEVFGGPDACQVTAPLQLTIDLPRASLLMREFVLAAIPILPRHALADVPPAQLRTHPANTWRTPWTVQTARGPYTTQGGIGTGPWICAGYDPAHQSFSYTRQPRHWRASPGNATAYRHVNIQATDALLAALRSGDVDAHDPVYDLGALPAGLDPALRILRLDGRKWQQLSYNLRHPLLGSGVETPLGKQDPARTSEAAAALRRAISYAIPRDEIIRQFGNEGRPGTVPIPFTAPEYDHEANRPIPFDMDLARRTLAQAGYG